MKLSTLTYKGYTGRVVNVSQSKDITDYVEECYITLPNSSYISSMEAKFTLYEKLIEAGNEVRIEVLDEVENVIYLLHGKATIPKRSKQYTGVEAFEYSIKDSYDKLFDKVVAEDMTFYDLYFCNTGDKGNSLLHKIAISLGFREDQCDFQDAIFPDGKYMRIPFIYLEENTRWVDKLQAFLEATNGILYVQNGMLHFRMRDSNVDMGLRFDRSNLLNHIEESQKELLQNGVKIVYDRYEKLENQVVFNLQKKIITEANTNQDTEVPTMRIGYITSSVSNPVLTKATGYFFTSDDPASKTDITLKEMEHYVIESWSATGAEVRFYNPLPHKLYIDNFEIKGIPLAMYESNEANVMFSNVLEKSQENLMTSTKSSMVQTREQADYLARKTMQKAIVNGKEYSFTTEFLHSIQIGKRYYLTIEDIQEEVEVRSIRISLRPNQFYMDIVADSMTKPLGEVKISNKYSATPNGQYIDLKPLEDKIDSTKSELVEKYDKKLLSLTEKYDEQLVNISDSHKEELSKITEKLGQLTQGIQDNKVKIYTLKPSYDTLTDLNIGDMYVSDTTVEILIKEGNRYVWKSMKDNETKQTLESYMQDTNSKLVTISYQFSAPESPNVGDIWIDTQNDGIWKRWNGSEWEQVDKNVRDTLKKANQDIQKIESSLETVNNTVNRKILAKAFVQEQEPKSGMKEYDVWYKPSTNTYKVYLNWRWNNASEDDIFPALRHYASLENAKLEIGKKIDKTNERAGLFLTNNDQTFGSKYGELAEVSLDKQGAIRLKNANNLLEWNVKDPWSTTKMKSKFYMGVTDVDKVPDNVYFKIGDETNGFSIELKEGERAKAKLDGKELSQKFGEVNDKVQQSKEELDRNINNLAQADSENKRDLEEKLNTAKKEINAQLVNADGKWTALQGQYQETVRDVTNFKEQATGRLDSYETALQNGNFVITGRTVFDGNVNIVSKGTNERLEINSGNLSIYRTINGVEKKVTRIGNIRYGSISTDSKGKGVVHFTDMKEPLLVMPTIKAVNFGGNMASAFCYSEYVSACVYKFFIGGTRETYETPKNIKTVGTVVSYSNIYQYTIEGFGFTFPYTDVYSRNADISTPTYSHSNGVDSKYFNSSEYVDKLFKFLYGYDYGNSDEDIWEQDKKRYDIGTTYIKPTFTIELKEYVNGEFNATIFSKEFTLGFYKAKFKRYCINSQDFTHALNIRRNFTNRTNVRVELVVTFTEPRMGINGTDFYESSKKKGIGSDTYTEYSYNVSIYREFELKRFSQASFEGYNIVSSYTSSKIEDSLGEGEVSYIAMEID